MGEKADPAESWWKSPWNLVRVTAARRHGCHLFAYNGVTSYADF
jgi:hypothetical protein